MSEEAEEFDEFDSLDPLDVIRTMIASAISLGAPVYNTGDYRGCYEIYAATARMLNHIVDGAEEERELLRGALELTALEVDVNEQAWVMRRAFDTILGEETVEEEVEEPTPPTE
ncbi:hypothetical protein [Zavarzinella formosa]|uniref:hypothetical protein n=1 Tax=Zavarzinella formosa TaxID=360055 RepID=UPI0003064AB6|nr:hypothetical protein [Zavarzinella formosa]